MNVDCSSIRKSTKENSPYQQTKKEKTHDHFNGSKKGFRKNPTIIHDFKNLSILGTKGSFLKLIQTSTKQHRVNIICNCEEE
jgi:hypothetical protein